MKKALWITLILGVTLGCGLLSRNTSQPDEVQITPSPEISPTTADVPEENLLDEENDPFAIPVTDTPDPEALAESVEVTGTITAIVDGQEMTWQTGLVPTQEGEASLASWSPFPLGVQEDLFMVRIISMPATQSFDVDEDAPVLGTRLEIEFIFSKPEAGRELDYTLTAEEPMTLESADILLFREEGSDTVAYEMMDGGLKISVEKAEPGAPASFTGTFQGKLAYLNLEDISGELDLSRTLEISGGTFEVDNVVFDEE